MVDQPTPHRDINETVNLLLSRIRAVLGDKFVGLYLGGSLALGDFDPNRSDIDFIAVTVDALRSEMIVALETMHSRLWSTGEKWAMRLDGSYVPQDVLRHWTSEHLPCPFVEGDSFLVTNQGSAVIQRHIIRQYGVVVAGPHPHVLIEPVDADELRSAVRGMLEEWWRPLLDDPAWVRQTQYQPFAILTMCRSLYILDQGEVVSKPVAARWAQQTIGEPWTALIKSALIEWALTSPCDAESNHLPLTLSFIHYTLKRFSAG